MVVDIVAVKRESSILVWIGDGAVGPVSRIVYCEAAALERESERCRDIVRWRIGRRCSPWEGEGVRGADSRARSGLGGEVEAREN